MPAATITLNATQGSLLGFLHERPEDRMGPAAGGVARAGPVLERDREPPLPRAEGARGAGPDRGGRAGPARSPAVRHHPRRRRGVRRVDRAGTRARADPDPVARLALVREAPRRRDARRLHRVASRRRTRNGSPSTARSRGSRPVATRTSTRSCSSGSPTRRRSSRGSLRCRSARAASLEPTHG